MDIPLLRSTGVKRRGDSRGWREYEVGRGSWIWGGSAIGRFFHLWILERIGDFIAILPRNVRGVEISSSANT